MAYSTTDENSLAAPAHELLREISTHTPEVLKAHIKEICRLVEEEAPTAQKSNSLSAVDSLKACAAFASRFSDDLPNDRKFEQTMIAFALHGSPPEAAKYAVAIIMASSAKKEMIAKDLTSACVKDFTYGKDGFLARLASLSQLWLLAPDYVDENSDAIIDIAIKQVLLKTKSRRDNSDEYAWSDEVDAECTAKCWAIKILVNRLRSHPTASTLAEVAKPIHKILSTLITKEGELTDDGLTPGNCRTRLRLVAARSCLKLCLKKSHESLLSAIEFNQLAQVSQDSIFEVRASFLQRLRKYLATGKLAVRFYAIPFLAAFEPDSKLKADVSTWIRNRATYFSNLNGQESSASKVDPTPMKSRASVVFELTFARLLSLLAHHPDYSPSPEDLTDFARYIIFYLQNVASEENLSLVYHCAQKVKACRDAISASTPIADPKDMATMFDDNLYHLSDLAQLTIRRYEEALGWTMQTLPSNAKLSLPHTLFREIKDHAEAMGIAEKNFVPEGVAEEVNDLVKRSLKKERSGGVNGIGRKRRSEGGDGDDRKSKKAKADKRLWTRKATYAIAKPVKTPKRARGKVNEDDWDKESRREAEMHDSERRRSGRVRAVGEKAYAERDDEEDDQEMEELDRESDRESDESAGTQHDGEDVQVGKEVFKSQGESGGDDTKKILGEVEKSLGPDTNRQAIQKRGKGRQASQSTTNVKMKNSGESVPNGRATRSRVKSEALGSKEAEKDDDGDLSDPPDSN